MKYYLMFLYMLTISTNANTGNTKQDPSTSNNVNDLSLNDAT